jgi:Protein of unknown function (DUF1488)
LAWDEAFNRGAAWRQALTEGLSQLAPRVRDHVLKIAGKQRNIIPKLDLIFADKTPHYNSHRDVVTFSGEALGHKVHCAISREALDDNFEPKNNTSAAEHLNKFRKNRSAIERIAKHKYLNWPIEDPEEVLLKTTEVPTLLEEISKKSTGDR